MPVVWRDILIVLLLILFNGFFALAELAIISSRKTRLQHLANEGNSRAKLAVQLANNPGIFLSSVQVGITLISVLAGAFGGATLSDAFARLLVHVPILVPYHHTISFIVVVLGITYLTMVIGELVPKRLALSNPERLALLVAPAIHSVSVIALPVVRLLDASSNLVLKAFRLPPRIRPPISDEEIEMLFEEGISAGVFERTEKEIVERLFRLSDRRVNALMTLRGDIVWLDIHSPQEEVERIIAGHDFSAYPVCDGSLDNVLGVVLSRDVIERVLETKPVHLSEMLRTPLFLPEGYRALRAIEQLKQSGTLIAIIINEYGVTEGLLTLTDIFESLVGEIPSAEEPEVVRREDGSLLVDGFYPKDDLKELLVVRALPREEENYQTLAGFIIAYLDRVPYVGDTFDWDGYCFEVVDMDGNRIDRVLIAPHK